MAGEPRTVLLALCILFLILVPLFIILRVRSRRLKGVGICIEDWLLIAAALLNTGNCVNLIVGSTAGTLGLHEEFGEHGLPIITDRRIIAFKTQYITQVLAIAVEGLTKLSLLMLYRRIFQWPLFRIVNSVWLGVVVVWTVAYFFAFAFQCSPVSTLWTTPLSVATPGACIEWQGFYLSSAITDVITDAMILALPVPCIWKLHMPWRRRLGICLIFMLGAFVLATGSIRTAEFVDTDNHKNTGPPDLSYIFADPLIWTVVELSTGIICASLPTFTPLFDAAIKGSLAWYMPKSLSLRSLVSKNNSNSAVSKQNFSEEAARSFGSMPARKHTGWTSVASTVGESKWQTEEVPLHDKLRTAPDNGEIVVKHDVDVEVSSLRKM